jgi:hypothetical protein
MSFQPGAYSRLLLRMEMRSFPAPGDQNKPEVSFPPDSERDCWMSHEVGYQRKCWRREATGYLYTLPFRRHCKI